MNDSTTPRRMIVDGMTFAEIVDVARSDADGLNARIWHEYDKYTAQARKRRTARPVSFKPLVIPRKSGITWAVRFGSDGAKDFRKWGLTWTLYGLFQYRGGLWAVYTYGGAWNVSRTKYVYKYALFAPHYFDRYRERQLKDDTRPTVDVVHEHFKYNSLAVVEHTADGFACTTEQGTAFGREENGVYLYLTFVSNDLLFNDQREWRERAINEIQEYKTLFNK